MTTSFYGQSLPEVFQYRIHSTAFKNVFPIAFNYSEICDCSVFNLNHYLLLSYSRMNKVIKRKKIWDVSRIFTPFLQSFTCLKEYFLTCKVTLVKGQVVRVLQFDERRRASFKGGHDDEEQINRRSFFKWFVLSPKNTWGSSLITIIFHWIVEAFLIFFLISPLKHFCISRGIAETFILPSWVISYKPWFLYVTRVIGVTGHCFFFFWSYITCIVFLMCTFFCKRASMRVTGWLRAHNVLNLTSQVTVSTAAPSLFIYC